MSNWTKPLESVASTTPVFFKADEAPDGVSVPEICMAAESKIGYGNVAGAVKKSNLWRIHGKCADDKAKLLAPDGPWPCIIIQRKENDELKSYKIRLYAKNPLSSTLDENGDVVPTTKLIIDGFLLSVSGEDIKKSLEKLGVNVTSKVFFDRAWLTNGKLSRFVNGRRFCYITEPSDNKPVPRVLNVGYFKASLWHRGMPKEPIKCWDCSGPHRRGDVNCPFFGKKNLSKGSTRNVETIKDGQNISSADNTHTKTVVNQKENDIVCDKSTGSQSSNDHVDHEAEAVALLKELRRDIVLEGDAEDVEVNLSGPKLCPSSDEYQRASSGDAQGEASDMMTDNSLLQGSEYDAMSDDMRESDEENYSTDDSMDDDRKEGKRGDVEYEYSDDSTENGSGTDSHGDESSESGSGENPQGSQSISDMHGGGTETIFGDILQNSDNNMTNSVVAPESPNMRESVNNDRSGAPQGDISAGSAQSNVEGGPKGPENKSVWDEMFLGPISRLKHRLIGEETVNAQNETAKQADEPQMEKQADEPQIEKSSIDRGSDLKEHNVAPVKKKKNDENKTTPKNVNTGSNKHPKKRGKMQQSIRTHFTPNGVRKRQVSSPDDTGTSKKNKHYA